MSNKILISSNTCYQLIVAIQMAITEYADNDVECIITDIVPEAENLVARIRELRVFSEVYLVKIKSSNYEAVSKKRFEMYFLRSIEKEIVSLIKNASDYDIYLLANSGGFSDRLGRSLKKCNPKIKIEMYEDGVSSYCLLMGQYVNAALCPRTFKEKIKKLLGLSVLSSLNGYHVFYRDLMVWDCPVEVKQISPISSENCEVIRNILNGVFNYDGIEDKYEEKVIFFEESYVGDGIEVDDVRVVESLKEQFGIDNILVKKHPRKSNDRFEKMGYKTNKDLYIPWEVVLLNLADLDNKILVTMTSSALVNTFLIRKSNATIIFSYENLKNNSNRRIQDTIKVIERLISLYPDNIMSSLPKH